MRILPQADAPPQGHETARTRVLSDDESRTLVNAFDQPRYGGALRLRLLSALRRDEVGGGCCSYLGSGPGEKPRLTPTLLVYADLLATVDSRCLETAQILRAPLLARLWLIPRGYLS